MKNYLTHLHADILAAHREAPEMECSTEGILPKHTFSHYCGMTKEQFPPSELLTEAELEALSLAFRIMMFSWEIDAELPVKLPPGRTYELLISVLDRQVVVGTPGIDLLAFCDFEPATCPFGLSYCGCLDCFPDETQRAYHDWKGGDPPSLP